MCSTISDCYLYFDVTGLFRLYLTVILKDLVNVFQFWMVRKEVDFMKKVLYFLPEMKISWRKDFTQKTKYKYIKIIFCYIVFFVL